MASRARAPHRAGRPRERAHDYFRGRSEALPERSRSPEQRQPARRTRGNGFSNRPLGGGEKYGTQTHRVARTTDARECVRGRLRALPKPRVIELLLVTTAPVMILAAKGELRPGLPRPRDRDPGRRQPLRRQRQRLQLLHRPRHRPAHEAHAEPAPGHGGAEPPGGPRLRLDLRCRLDRRAVGLHHLAGRRAVVRRDRLLRTRLHARPQAPYAAEHRLGRRCGMHAGAHRLGGRDGRPVVAAGDPLRHRVPLDAAALLAPFSMRYRDDYEATSVPMLAVVRGRPPSACRSCCTRGRPWSARCC